VGSSLPIRSDNLIYGGERGIRTLEVHASSITCRLFVALRARVARVATAPWPMLAQRKISVIEENQIAQGH
jgi:hypothetical protein